MKAYKIELLVIDFDELGEELLRDEILNARYPNDCVSPTIKSVTGRDIGEWTDGHPLNQRSTCDEEYKRLFQ